MNRGLKLLYDRTSDAERYSETEYDEQPDTPEGGEIPDEVEKTTAETAEDIERQKAIEQIANEAAKEFDEYETMLKEIEDLAEAAAKEFDELQREKDMDGKESFEDELENDLDEVRVELHDEYVNDMNHQIEGVSRKDIDIEEGGEEGSSSEMTESSESYEEAGSGMVYTMETKNESEYDKNSEVESEVEYEKQEHSERSKPMDDVKEQPDEEFRNRITRPESAETEQEEYSSSGTTESVEKQGIKQPESSEPSGVTEPEVSKGETPQENQSEFEHEETREYIADDSLYPAEEPEESEVKSDLEDTLEIEESHNATEVHDEPKLDELEHVDVPIEGSNVESQNGTESQEVSDEEQKVAESAASEMVENEEREIENDLQNEIVEEEDLPEDFEAFVKRVKDMLDLKMGMDDNYDYVQDPLTGEMQRVPNILAEYETEDQKHRRRLRNLFAELSEEEREQFKKIVRENAESEDEHPAEAVEKAWSQIVKTAMLNSENQSDARFKVTMKESGCIQETKELVDELLVRISESEKHVSYLELDLDENDQKDTHRLSESLEKSKDTLGKEIQKRLKIEETEVRIGVVDDRVYLWISDTSRNNMLNAWSKQYYYFKENEMLERLQESALSNLGLNPRLPESKIHFNKIMDEILQNTDNETLRKSRHLKENRIHGETLKFLLDAMGHDTELLEKRVEKITGIKGQGGLENPDFPKGEELEILRARVIGTVVSDGQVRGSKGLMYYESTEDRINRFENTLRNFGDIHLKRKFRKSRGVYEIYINSAMSEAAIFWGIPEGDRTILNYGLPSDVHNWSKDAQRALIQDMFSQEGCVSENGEISWNRRHALCAGNKSEKYDFQSKLSQEAVEFLKTSKEANREYETGNAGEIYLTIGQLENLQNDQDEFKANAAKEILKVVYDYRNQLIDDEATIVRGFGINVSVDPMQVSYYRRSGRVSVRWQARIRDDDSKMKCAFLMKPNDSTKEQIMDEWLSKQTLEDIESVRNSLKDEGYEIRSTVPRDEPPHSGRDPS